MNRSLIAEALAKVVELNDSGYINCPSCSDSRKRLGYTRQHKDDGSEGYLFHCFNCDAAGYFPTLTHKTLSTYYNTKKTDEFITGNNYVAHTYKQIDLTIYREYLNKYKDMTVSMVLYRRLVETGVMCQDSNGCVTFLVRNELQLPADPTIGAQTRTITGKPKYLTTFFVRDNGIIKKHIIDNCRKLSEKCSLVITEDILAAEYVASVASSIKLPLLVMAALGTNISMEVLMELSPYIHRTMIWLDDDNAFVKRSQIDIANRSQLLDIPARIVPGGDPKSMPAKQILNELGGF